MAMTLTIESYGDEVTPEWVETMMEVLEKATWRQECSLEDVFPTRLLSKLLKDCQALLRKEPTVVDIEVPRDAKINIVGDTHGQFHDVLTLLGSAGRPSEKNLFLFNGDFVDRGYWGVEVLSTLLSWKVRMGSPLLPSSSSSPSLLIDPDCHPARLSHFLLCSR